MSIFLPLKGVSILDSPGNEFWWPEADQALYDAIQSNVSADVTVTEMDCNINDPAFAEAVTGTAAVRSEGVRPPCPSSTRSSSTTSPCP